MTTKLRLLVLLLGCSIGSVRAEVAETLLEQAGLEAYPDSSVLTSSGPDRVSYELMLSSLKKARGELAPDRMQRLRGELRRVTWRVPDGRPPGEVFNYFLEQLEARTRDLLYTCQGRDCGSSNDWANQVFRVPQLYGPDEDQSYLAARLQGSDVSQLLALYVIRRGNRRLYAHMDLLTVAADDAARISPNPETFLALLKKHRRAVLPRIRFGEQQQVLETDPEAIALAVGALKRELRLRVAVVAHAVSGQGIARDLDISQARARGVVELLVGAGIERQRLYPFGVGSLSPPFRAEEPVERVELVLP